MAVGIGEDSTNRAAIGRFESEGMESTQEPMVAYIPLEGEYVGKLRFRELWQWAELVTVDLQLGTDKPLRKPRFQHIDDYNAELDKVKV